MRAVRCGSVQRESVVGVVAALVGSPLQAQTGTKNARPAAATNVRSLRIAVVQMQSVDHDVDANLKRATTFAEQAAARGAEFILFPETMATESYLSADTWDQRNLPTASRFSG